MSPDASHFKLYLIKDFFDAHMCGEIIAELRDAEVNAATVLDEEIQLLSTKERARLRGSCLRRRLLRVSAADCWIEEKRLDHISGSN
jgi:hypothetical protein